MNTTIKSGRSSKSEQGYALALTMVIGGVVLALFAGAARWSATSSVINDRNNIYTRTVSAAEAASETVLSYIARDFFNQSFKPSNLAAYRSLVPATGWAAEFQFSDGAGQVNATAVESGSCVLITNLNSEFGWTR